MFNLVTLGLTGKIMNFTWKVKLSDDWGSSPKSGPYNMSGEWEGIMGNVILNQYPFSVSSWSSTWERSFLLDHAAVLKGKFIIYF